MNSVKRPGKLFSTLGVLLLIGTNPLAANNTYVTDFGTGDIGQGGWFSDDTRNADGNNLIGGPSYLNPGITHSPGQRPGNIYGSDAINQIRSQIQWNNYYGTRGNLGGLYLSGTTSASGKSTISALYSDKAAGNFGDASLMLGEDFSAAYRWQKLENLTPDPTVAGVSLKFGIRSTAWGNDSLESQGSYPLSPRRSGESSWDLILVYDPTNNGINPTGTGGYYTSEINADSKFFLFAQGGNEYWSMFYGANSSTLGIGAGSKTLAEWAATNISGEGEVGTLWGELLFGEGAEIANIQFGMGSGNANAQAQLDWAQLSFVNGGARIDFVDASLWTGTAGNGQFTDAANWDSGAPAADRNVVFAQSGETNVNVTADGSGIVESRSVGVGNGTVNLSISEGTTLSMRNDGFLSVENGAVLNVSGAGIVEGAALEVWGEASIASQVKLDGGSVHQPVRSGRYALVVAEGGELTLKSGADVIVAAEHGNTPVVRIGEGVGGSAGVLNVEEGASLTVGDALQYGTFQVGDWGSKGVVNQSGGNVSVTGSMNIGNQSGTGVYNLTGGTLTFGGDTGPGGNVSTFTLGRRVSTNYAVGDSSGTLNVSGDAELNIVKGSAGNVYFLIGGNADPNGGPLSGGEGYRVGAGLLNQTGGTITVDEGVFFGFGQGVGVYNLAGGTLRVGGVDGIRKFGNAAGSSYSFNFGDATLEIHSADFSTKLDIDLIAGTTPTIDTAGFNASFYGSINGDEASLLKIGAGKLTLAGADGNTLESLFVNRGTVELASTSSLEISESLNVGVGEGVSGLFIQQGGTVSLSDGGVLTVGGQGSGNGSYHLNGGTLNLGEGVHSIARAAEGDGDTTGVVAIFDGRLNLQDGGDFVIGNIEQSTAQARGVVTQYGGTLHVANDARLYLSGQSGEGAYTLKGGVLEVGGDSLRGSYNDGNGEYAFTLEGGTIRAHGTDLVSAVDAHLWQGSRSTLDTNELAVNWSGAFSGEGGLNVRGGGDFNITGDSNMGQLQVFDATTTIHSNLNLGGYNDAAKGGYYGLVVNEGGTLNLESGANVSVLAPDGTGQRNAHVRVGDYEGSVTGGVATLNVKDGASLNIGSTITAGDGQNSGRFYIGDWGTEGVVNQEGGHVGITGALHIGNQGGTGTYNMEGGTLDLGRAHGETAPDIMVSLGRSTSAARSQTGIMNVTGGEVRLYGNETGTGGGRIYLGGGDDLTSAGGYGEWNQNGGVLIIDPGARLRGARGTGVFNLGNGGVLRIGGANALQGAYTGGNFTFNWNDGGIIEIAGADFSTSNAINVNEGVAGLDTGTHTATFNGNLTGAGTLGIVGQGNAILNGTNTLAGIVLNEGAATNGFGTTSVGLLGVGYYATEPATTGTPIFTVSDGTVNVGVPAGMGQGDLTVGGGATKTGQLNVEGGTVNVGSADNFSRFFVGTYEGDGIVEQTGGQMNVSGFLNIGNTGGTGEYSISGGELLIGQHPVTTSSLLLGRSHNAQTAVSEGILNVSDTAQVTLQNNAILYVGGDKDSSGTQPELSRGTVNQSGGTVTLEAGSKLHFGAGTGTYNLTGGTLQIGGVNTIRSLTPTSDYAFNLGGGTLEVTSALETSIAMTRATGTTSVIDTRAGDAIIHGGIGGSGSLTHVSNGNLLALGGLNTFSDGDVLRTNTGAVRIGTDLSEGTLVLEEGSRVVIHGDGGVADLAVGQTAGNRGYLEIHGGEIELFADSSRAGLRVGYEGGVGHGVMTGGRIYDNSVGTYGIFEVGYYGDGTFEQSGGEVDFEHSAFHVGAGGLTSPAVIAEYTLTGDARMYLGDGVTARVGAQGIGSTGTLHVGEDAQLIFEGADAYIGSFGATGLIHQTGGTVDVIRTSLSIGSSGNATWTGGSGTYLLEGGSLNFSGTGGGTLLGRHAGTSGVIDQSGGTLTASDGRTLTVGNAGTGSYLLSGGTAVFNDTNLVIANSAGSTGEVVQSDGTLTMDGGEIRFGSGNGVYNLTGGTLRVGGANAIRSGAGDYAFNLGGGKLEIRGSSFSTGVDMTLVDGTRSVIDTGEGLASVFDGTISGTGDLDIDGAGRVVFAADQTYTGETLVKSGELEVQSGLASRKVEVGSGAILSGNGNLAGDVFILNGGLLSAGSSGAFAHMTMNSLTLSESSEVLFNLGSFNAGQGVGYDAITILGDLVLDGKFLFSHADAFELGTYDIIGFGGTLSDNGVELNGLSTDYSYKLETADDFIRLIVSAAAATDIQYWNGTRTGITTGGAQGGDGIWNNELTNFINDEGTYASSWKGQHAIFSGEAGTVTLGDNVAFEALSFETDGYRINGDADGDFSLSATGNATVTVASGNTAAIDAQLGGETSSSIQVQGGGELQLLADNNYAGDFIISGENTRLVMKGDTSNLGGTITNIDGTLAFDQLADSSFNQAISGAGSLHQDGDTVLTLSGVNAYTGATVINRGTVSFTGNTSALSGGAVIADGARLQFAQAEDSSFNSVISGAGGVEQAGLGVLSLTAANTYTGATTISSGTVRINSDSNLGLGGELNMAGGTLDVASPAVISRNIGGTGGEIRANANLFLGAIDGSSTINTGASLNAGHNHIYLISNQRSVIGGFSLAEGGKLIAANGAELIGGMGLATGNAEVVGRFINNGALVGPTGEGERLVFTGLVSGAGSTSGYIAYRGGYRPGNSIALIEVGAGSILEFYNEPLFLEISAYHRGPDGAGFGYDSFNVGANATIHFFGSSAIDISFIDGFEPTQEYAFQFFQLEEGATIVVNFTEDRFFLPTLSDGYYWDTSAFAATGVISISAVPEPGHYAMLVGLVLATGVMLRRRMAAKRK